MVKKTRRMSEMTFTGGEVDRIVNLLSEFVPPSPASVTTVLRLTGNKLEVELCLPEPMWWCGRALWLGQEAPRSWTPCGFTLLCADIVNLELPYTAQRMNEFLETICFEENPDELTRDLKRFLREFMTSVKAPFLELMHTQSTIACWQESAEEEQHGRSFYTKSHTQDGRFYETMISSIHGHVQEAYGDFTSAVRDMEVRLLNANDKDKMWRNVYYTQSPSRDFAKEAERHTVQFHALHPVVHRHTTARVQTINAGNPTDGGGGGGGAAKEGDRTNALKRKHGKLAADES